MNRLTRWPLVLSAALLLLMLPQARMEGQWMESKGAHYSVFYQKGFEADTLFARTWAERAEQTMRDKYHVALDGWHIAIYLHPVPEDRIDINTARNRCCGKAPNGDSTARIDMLTPSAPAMRAADAISSLGLPKNSENYQAKILVSEYIPLGHYAVQDGRAAGGWKYYSAPNWFVQGLQEYDAIFHSTEGNARGTADALSKWAASRAATLCCGPDHRLADDYNGGAAFIAFLAKQFGEDVHRRILASSADSFWAALTEQTRPYTTDQLFDLFQRWLQQGAPVR